MPETRTEHDGIIGITTSPEPEPEEQLPYLTVELDRSIFKFAKTFCAADDSRPVLSCIAIYLEPQRVMAANGFTAAWIPCKVMGPQTYTEPYVLVSRTDLERARKLHTSKDQPVMLHYIPDDDKWTITAIDRSGSITFPIFTQQGTFPDLDGVIPSSEIADDTLVSSFFLNPEFVRDIAAYQVERANKVGDGSPLIRIQRYTIDPSTPVEIGGHDWRGLVMPMVGGSGDREMRKEQPIPNHRASDEIDALRFTLRNLKATYGDYVGKQAETQTERINYEEFMEDFEKFVSTHTDGM